MSATLDWDYSALAEHYRLRAPYAAAAIDALLAIGAIRAGDACVDVGAGTGRLTALLVERGLHVTALEPNAPMRAIGRREVAGATWLDARGEAPGLPPHCARLVTFGSSFNVMPASDALHGAATLLDGGGWLACLWNHRDLDDPGQARLQAVIERHVPGYRHGARRDDPSALIEADGRFGAVSSLRIRFHHTTSTHAFVEGFRAHATLVRQAGAALPRVLAALEDELRGQSTIAVPFSTRVYLAQRAS